MLIGFNNDVEHRGKTFHIQTEDHGESDCRIETQLFYSGAILDTVITSYEETIEGYEGKEAEERIRAQMKASHRSLFKKLKAGEYDAFAGLEPLDVAPAEIDEAEDFTPSQDRVPAAAARIEEEGEDAILEFQKEKAEQHFSLDQLKDQLSTIGDSSDMGDADESDAQDDVAATQVIGPDLSPMPAAPAPDAADRPAQAVAPPKPMLPKPLIPPTSLAASAPADVELVATGARAWDGCRPCDADLGLTELVEAFLGL